MEGMCNFYANFTALHVLDLSICRFSHKLRSKNQFLEDTARHLHIVGLGLMIGHSQVVKSLGEVQRVPCRIHS